MIIFFFKYNYESIFNVILIIIFLNENTKLDYSPKFMYALNLLNLFIGTIFLFDIKT